MTPAMVMLTSQIPAESRLGFVPDKSVNAGESTSART